MSGYEADRIRSAMGQDELAALRELTVLGTTDSTNAELARRPGAERHAHAVLAETQSAGRGRRQRRWHSPPGGNLYLSVGWRFGFSPERLAPFPLACAVIAARTVERAGAGAIRIKWPNDLLLDGRKLGGILVESKVGRRGNCDVIAGVGLNVQMDAASAPDDRIDQPWTDLASHIAVAQERGFRDRLAGELIGALISGFDVYAAEGFAPYLAAWERFDILAGRSVEVSTDGDPAIGRALGITDAGALRVAVANGKVREFLAGDVSVRAR